MNIMIKTWKHFSLVNKHRWIVFKLCCKAGIPWRGLVHDLSKYSPTEFKEGVKYFDGNKSPISVCRANNGYSLAWMHHKGRNKHHFEYWEDISKKARIPVQVPYPYLVESVCDKISAGMVYLGKDWNQKEPYDYWLKNEKTYPVERYPESVQFMDTVLKKISDEGLDVALDTNYLKSVYNDCHEK